MRIACWSGPRNISTALMRSWSSRKDSFVSDEPFYAYYLKERKLKHPMYKEIIQYYPNTYDDVVASLISEIPNGKEHWYQKHMAHHLIDLNNIDWIKNFENCILIRHPKNVINSYIKKNNLYHVDELGYRQQYQLIKNLKKNKMDVTVIDSNILLANPRKILSQWCSRLGINFDENMLKWEKAIYPTDGIWGKHWYDSVRNTNKFSKKITQNKNIKINSKYCSIYDECVEYYKEMYSMTLH